MAASAHEVAAAAKGSHFQPHISEVSATVSRFITPMLAASDIAAAITIFTAAYRRLDMSMP